MRLSNGIIQKLVNETGLKTSYLSDLASTRKRPGRNRSILLEKACAKLGLNVPKETWMFGTTEEIKSALITCNQKSETRQ